MSFNVIFVVVIGCVLCQTVAGNNVPVIIWGTASHYTPATALKSYSSDEFTDILTSYIKDDTFGVVITEPNLTTEDISLCRTPDGITCFADIQKIPNKLYMASVENPLDTLQEIGGGDANEQPDIYVSPDNVISRPIVPEAGKFIFVHMEDGKTDESINSILARHDQFIAKLTKELEAQNKNLVIIYTSADQVNRGRYARDLSVAHNHTNDNETDVQPLMHRAPGTIVSNAEDHTNATVFKDEHFLIYYKQLVAIVKDKEDTPIHMNKMTVRDAGDELQIELTDGTNKLQFSFNSSDGYWNINNLQWNGLKLFSNIVIAAINGFSYHCTPEIIYKVLDNKGLEPTIGLSGLQVEGKLKQADVPWTPLDEFSEPWDCVGFTSPAVLSGLFVTFMLLLILTAGLSWIMDIRTMDRFDDPKGKTITINVNE